MTYLDRNTHRVKRRADGLMVVRSGGVAYGSLIKGLFAFMLLVAVFKAIVLIENGPQGYADRMAAPFAGTPVEGAATWFARPGPLTLIMAGILDGYVR